MSTDLVRIRFLLNLINVCNSSVSNHFNVCFYFIGINGKTVDLAAISLIVWPLVLLPFSEVTKSSFEMLLVAQTKRQNSLKEEENYKNKNAKMFLANVLKVLDSICSHIKSPWLHVWCKVSCECTARVTTSTHFPQSRATQRENFSGQTSCISPERTLPAELFTVVNMRGFHTCWLLHRWDFL